MGATIRQSLGRKLRLAGRLGLILSLVTCTIAEDAPAANAQNAQSAQTEKVTLERGRVLELELVTSFSSESAKIGDRLQLRLARPVMSGGAIVLPAGWMVPAHITSVRRAGKRDCKDGKISWKIDRATAADGTRVSLVRLPREPRSRDGNPTDVVHLDSTGEKVGSGLKWVVLGPVFAVDLVLFLPAGLAMALGEGEPCRGQPGTDTSLPTGATLYAAVAKTVRVTATSPATP